MALFAFWRNDTGPPADIAHSRLAEASHLVPQHSAHLTLAGWHAAAFATATRFHGAEAQIFADPQSGICILHGLPWSLATARPLDAAALARLLDRPGRTPPADLVGEYAVARLHPCGTLEAFGDPAGVHQLFHHADRGDLLANRAALVATLAGDPAPDPESALWLSAIGYRVGPATGWRGVRQVAQATRITLTSGPARFGALPDPAIVTGPRGDDPDLYAAGLDEAKAACRLAAGDGPLDLPVTGGKDSRAVLALCLAAGLRDRLTLTTRGLPGHPDVLAAQGIAAVLGLPHRREPPRDTDAPADLTVDRFVHALGEHVFQTDGGMGGWDLLVAAAPGADSLVTGHMGETLKAFSKQPVQPDLDPISLVRLQSPFDPLGLLRPAALSALTAALAAGLADVPPDDRPDLFYYRNRIPNWLGGIRGVRSFERQPVMPLAAPSLQRLAFRLPAEDRRAERLHHRIVRDLAPELLPLPFAHQSWPALLGEPAVPPLVAAGDVPLFGNWQWSINTVPAIRVWLSDFVVRHDLPLWDGLDRAALLDRLRHHRFGYLDGIALLGLAAAAFHQAGLIVRSRIGAPATGPHHAAPAPAVTGHVDIATPDLIGGWAWSPDWPGAAPAIVARDDLGELARAPAAAGRPDLAAAGFGDGRYGFTLRPTRPPRGPVTVSGLDAPAPLAENLAP